MKLHQEVKLFSDALRATAQYLNMRVEFVEKDYWSTLVLSRLATSKYVDKSVFKGGTSLSKGYNLIDRFSEDVDLAIINDENAQGNPVKTIIRNIEKEITSELTEIPFEGITSKGSRFRKSVFEYPTTEKNNSNNKLIVEINSFANPFPYQRLSIQSMVNDFLIETKNDAYIDTYNLRPFQINVLSKQQTLLEKMVSLIRFSFKEEAFEGISQKIRHFYDLNFLMSDEECKKFVASESFKSDFDRILQHDRELFEEPDGWQGKSILDSPLVSDFSNSWERLKDKYQTELAALAFRPIPNETEIAKCFEYLISRIK